ncbi:acetyl-CoA carboxylase carboxyl transferase subunit alpha, partial [archaeon]
MAEKRTIELLEAKIQELRELNKMEEIDMSSEIARLAEKLEGLKIDTYSNLSDWERVKIARHPERPYALDYIDKAFADFYELHGDRISGDDRALLVGLAQLQGKPVVLLAQQKGHSTEENKQRYFGMPR